MAQRALPMALVEVARRTKYPLDAFVFVQKGLDFTVRRIHGEHKIDTPDESRHVTGQDLAYGLRDFATRQYGLMARTVLRRWNITRTEDFGRIVFAMVDAGLMKKTDHDTVADFKDVYDFAEQFSGDLKLRENTPAKG